MPLKDTLQSIVDTAVNLKPDSIMKPDSIQATDTAKIAISHEIHFTGYEGILHPSFANSENWVFITLLVLFGIFIF